MTLQQLILHLLRLRDQARADGFSEKQIEQAIVNALAQMFG